MSAKDHGDLRAFFDYWKSKQADPRPPRRCDIDPTEIPKLLPNILLLDVIGNPAYDFHYRLLGTSIVAFNGADHSGSTLSQIVPRTDAYHVVWEHHLNTAAGAIELRRDSVHWRRDDSRDHLDYLILLLPLRRSGDTIEALFGYIHYIVENTTRGWSIR